MRIFDSPAALLDATGDHLGPGPATVIDQERVDTFADVTDDHQWIHTDPTRAAHGPFGGTVAHGYLTLSLLPSFIRGLYRVRGARLIVNYGLNRVRFPAPLRTGDTVRATARLDQAHQVGDAVQVHLLVTIQADGADKPCCVAESLSRFYPEEEA
ncbi:MaoC family dehydratase [Actinoalloteichus sp. AHMU CJ021]|uniref:Acyl dehydratase n=1 Tax=Actinoalloteichus caeruleus DSM 43889 TaxID=1120930 RepID=A0ABT1JF01_ACTCY|nr:MaoC family dehydratase [Actinoalloteichus caeruleus]AUS77240.1 MaoC family dehydratase [Actinoalloteichus sp. AHMU CJ021]MCP2331056.1 Acyl dehydratase [Actinoalloteichus caeruleus DSM 43889]